MGCVTARDETVQIRDESGQDITNNDQGLSMHQWQYII